MSTKIVIATAAATLLIVLIVVLKCVARRRTGRARAVASIQHARLVRAAHAARAADRPSEVELEAIEEPELEEEDLENVATYEKALEDFDITNP